jgi:hypothetical protein
MSSTRGNVRQIITFNYDDLLEIYLEYHGFTTHSVFEPNHWAANADVTVYHPHGMLSLRDSSRRSTNIVLDQESYSQIVGVADNPWHQLLVTLLRTHTTLIIGSSVKDDHMDSLLLRAKTNHAAMDASLDGHKALYSAVRIGTDSGAMKGILANRGVFSWTIPNYNVLSNILFEICQEAAKLRTSH